MNRLLSASRRCRTEAWTSAALSSTAASCRCSQLQRGEPRTSSAALGAAPPATLQFARSTSSATGSAPIRQAQTLGELQESCRHALDAGELTPQEVSQLARDKKALLVSSWRSVFGLQREDLRSAPLELLEVFLDTMLKEEFAGVGTRCRVLVHDQTAVLRALHGRVDCGRLAESHQLVPVLVYNVVSHLDSLDFCESLGDELHNVCVMLLVYLCRFRKSEKLRHAAIRTVFARAARQAPASPEATLKLLRLFGAVQHVVEPSTGGHLLACAEQHLGRASEPAADTHAELRLALVALSGVSVSFARLALRDIPDAVLERASAGQCCAMLLAAEGSADRAWSHLLPKCRSLSLLEALALLDKVLASYREALIDEAQFRERAAVLLQCLSDACEQPELNCTAGEVLQRGSCLVQLRGHPAVQKLAGRLQAHLEASATACEMRAEELAKLAYFFSLLGVELSPKLFPDGAELSLDPRLVCADPTAAELLASSAAAASAEEEETKEKKKGGGKEAGEPDSEWSDGWVTL